MAKFASLEHARVSVMGATIVLKPGDVLDSDLHPVTALQNAGIALHELTNQARIDCVARFNARSRTEGDPEGSLVASLLVIGEL